MSRAEDENLQDLIKELSSILLGGFREWGSLVSAAAGRTSRNEELMRVHDWIVA